MQNVPEIRTIEDLRNVLKQEWSEEVTDENLIWFTCCAEAKVILDSCSVSDLASIFQMGTEPINTITDVQKHISKVHGEWDHAVYANRVLYNEVLAFCGKNEIEYDDEEGSDD
jgi:hypothetical protein